MTSSQIEKLGACVAESEQGDVQLMETHISWVLLGAVLAWKIKKPVKLDFLDFTELETRHYYCRRELQLNQRLSPDVYLAVTPVFHDGDRFSFNTEEGEIVDYAVVMRKLDNSLLLSEKLKSGTVTEKFMEKLASKLAAFHQSETPVYNEWDETVALKKAFLSAYQNELPVILMKEDVLIFKYFCLVRAAIRFHVTSLKGISRELTPAEWEAVGAYAKLAQKYSGQLSRLTEHYIHFEKDVFRFEDTFD